MKNRISAVIMITFVTGAALGFGFGFEFGTGLPMTSLFMPSQESVSLPEDVTVKTTEEARQAIAEAVKDKSYGTGYNCLDYAWSSMRALRWDGQPAAIAGVIFGDGRGHALILTATTDDNWVFLDAETGIEVHPVPGGYWGGKKIVAVKIMIRHWVDFEDFTKNPVLEVQE